MKFDKNGLLITKFFLLYRLLKHLKWFEIVEPGFMATTEMEREHGIWMQAHNLVTGI